MPTDAPRLREDLLVHAGFVRALAKATLRGDAECEDLEQDVWRDALVGAPAEPSRQRPWLVTVMRRRAADFLRKKGRRTGGGGGDGVVAPTSESAADHVVRAETGRRLVAALLAVEEPFRTAVLLRFQDGLPPREIARRTDVPVETARSRVRRGLERLRTLLAERERKEGRSAPAVLLALDDGETSATGTILTTGGAIVGWKLGAGVAVLILSGLAAVATLRVGPDDGPRTDPLSGTPPEAATALPTAPPPGTGLASAPRPVAPSSPAAAPPASSPPLAGVVGGRVVGDGDVPIPGAIVETVPPGMSWLVDPLGARGSPHDGPSATTTDADGRFEVPRSALLGGAAQVRVRASGWCSPSLEAGAGLVHVPRDGQTTIRLVRGIRFDVLVVEDGGRRPIAGARVRLSTGAGYVLFTSGPLTEETTGGEGLASFTVPGGALRVVASAPGYAEREGESVTVGPGGGRSVVRLVRGGTLDVDVVDSAGGPVAGAYVMCLRPPAAVLRATTDGEGRVRFVNVPPPEQEPAGFDGRRLALLVVAKDGYARSQRAVETPADGATTRTTLTLARPVALSGALQTRSGTPAPGWTVVGANRAGGLSWGFASESYALRATTDREGRFTLIDVAPGTVVLRAHAPGRTPPQAPHRVLEVPVGGPIEPVDLRIEDAELAPTRIRVRVLDAAGAPVPSARVVLVPKAGDISHELDFRALTGTDGAVDVEPAGPGPWWLGVDAPGASPIVRTLDAAEAAAGPVSVRRAPGSVRGRVVRSDGRGVALRLALAASLPVRGGIGRFDGIVGAVESDADGRFELRGSGEGIDDVSVFTHGWTAIPGSALGAVAAADGELRVVVLDEAEAARLRIEVEVVDAATGGPMTASTEVQLSQDFARGYRGAWPVPGVPGVFRSDPRLPPGTWRVRAVAEGYATEDVETTVAADRDATRLTVRLSKSR